MTDRLSFANLIEQAKQALAAGDRATAESIFEQLSEPDAKTQPGGSEAPTLDPTDSLGSFEMPRLDPVLKALGELRRMLEADAERRKAGIADPDPSGGGPGPTSSDDLLDELPTQLIEAASRSWTGHVTPDATPVGTAHGAGTTMDRTPVAGEDGEYLPDTEAAGEYLDVVELREGDVVGRCRVIERIATGGMATVFRAHHTMLDIPVALKVMSPALLARKPSYARRFVREGQLAARIRHPNVAGVMDVGIDDWTGFHYLILELIEGGTARDRLNEVGPMPQREVARIGIHIGQALHAAAEVGVLHRDIKPENIMLATNGQAKLVDLGLARLVDDTERLTTIQTIPGTPAYMSPEQARGDGLDGRTDIYSLGATMYTLLTGASPYEGPHPLKTLMRVISDPPPDPMALRRDLSPIFGLTLFKMMAKDPERRFATPVDLVSRLTDVRNHLFDIGLD